MSRNTIALAITGVLAALLIYLPSINGPFLYDDLRQIVHNEGLHDLWDLPGVVFNGLRQIRVWQNLSFAVSWAISPEQTWGFKIVNLALHLLNAGLLYLFLRRVLPGRSFVIGLTVLLFISHPLQVQSVTYVMGRISLIQAFFYLVVVNLIAWRKETPLWLVPGVIAASLVGKESCALIPFAVVWFYLTIGGCTLRTLPRARVAAASAAALLIIPIWWLLRDPVSMYHGSSGFDLFPYGEYLITQLHYYSFYPYLVLNPASQSIIHPYPAMSVGVVVMAVTGLLVCAALVVIALRYRPQAPVVAFFIGLFFLSLAPTNSFVQMKNPFAEYRLYQTNILWMILLAMGIEAIGRWTTRRVTIHAIAAAALIFFGAFAWSHSMTYDDSLRVYSYALAAYPRSSELSVFVGSQHEQRGDLQQAETEFTRAIELSEHDTARSARPLFRLARLYVMTRRYRQACEQLDRIPSDGFRFGPPPREYFVVRMQCLAPLGREQEMLEVRAAGEGIYGEDAFDAVVMDRPQTE